ncbi:MAG TPA: hypothetical protein VMB91_12995 [Solirubrobacteraceae bacterium]|nr:hypothetical protein [Solirubrobacteraceae bacterium]
MPRPQPHTSTKRPPAPRAALLATLSVVAGTLLAACGGSSSPSASSPAAREHTSEQQAESKFVDFARCLREHGIQAEAISHPGGGHGLKINPGAATGPAAVEAAERACARYRPEPQRGNASPQQKVEMEEARQKFAKCMREHGIEVEVSSSGGIFIHATPGHGGPNPESPAFKQAQATCQKLLPGGGP